MSDPSRCFFNCSEFVCMQPLNVSVAESKGNYSPWRFRLFNKFKFLFSSDGTFSFHILKAIVLFLVFFILYNWLSTFCSQYFTSKDNRPIFLGCDFCQECDLYHIPNICIINVLLPTWIQRILSKTICRTPCTTQRADSSLTNEWNRGQNKFLVYLSRDTLDSACRPTLGHCQTEKS